MNRRHRDVDTDIDTHLRLFADAPSAEVAEAQERARLRLLDERQRLGTPDLVTTPVASWRWGTVALAMAATAVFVLTLQTPALWSTAIWSTAWRAAVGTIGQSAPRPHPSEDAVAAGEPIAIGEVARSSASAGRQLVLADGSQVEMRANSELVVESAVDGLAIRLHAGSIIVNAAKQRNGHLYVTTKDVTVAVVGTVFLVNAEDAGSRVAVIEGEVRVREGKVETKLRPGDQVSTSPKLVVRPLRDEIAWSRNADAHLRILDSFMKGMVATAGPLAPVRDQSRPANLTASQGAVGAGAQEFEEASIRPCDPDNVPPPPAGARGGGANSLQMTPGRTHALCLTLATLIRTAYGYAPADFFRNNGRAPGFNYTNVYGLGVEDGRRVRGGPDWVRTDSYTIDAVASDGADAATMSGPMLRALLEKRFGLQAHIETEQIPAFDLVVAPGGLKMKEGICTPRDPSEPPRTGGSTMDVVRKNLEAARRGATTAYPCGMVFASNGPNALAVGAGAGVPPLSGLLGVPVNDRTGIPNTTRFNYALEFSRDETVTGPLARALIGGPGLPDVQVASDPSAIPAAPSLATALEEQLGLRLEPAKTPREFIVIDHVERPAAN
jgi:uncharacterized protein (TIGR03435 family)